jgi:hypothetical protein
MPIDLITAHAYRSRHEDNPKGYVQRGEPSVQLPNAGPAEYRPPHADAAEVRFTSM